MTDVTGGATALGSRRRRRGLLAAGLVDSLGLSIGWTALALHVMATRGLRGFGILSAAMLVGVVVSAPTTGWLAARLDGRGLLWLTGSAEAVLRAAAFGSLVMGAPLPVVAVIVLASSVMAWAGFAGMRAEVDAADGGAAGLSAYTALIAAAEAGGAFLVTVLPAGPDGAFAPGVLLTIMVGYSLSLLPTLVMASGARTPRQAGRDAAGQGSVRPVRGLLAGGAAITLLATGPTLLAVGLAEEMYDRTAVAPALLAFTLGSLCGPWLAGRLGRAGSIPSLDWPLLGALIVGAWALAGTGVTGLVVAQLCSGMGVAAFEGTMDADVAGRARAGVTGALAWAASARAVGSAAAVALLPFATTGLAIPRAATVAMVVLAGGGIACALAIRLRAPAPPVTGSRVAT